MSDLESGLRHYAEAQLPRVLTQMDRDPDSPTFGCFDRDHWHYKIRDFASAILQQGVHTLEAVRTGVLGGDLLRQAGQEPDKPGLGGRVMEAWSVAAVNALGRLVDGRGRVNEYYPFEGSFPAAAFGLYAAARVLFDWQKDAPHLLEKVNPEPLRRLARHLAGRREAQAWNQQAAGLAGLALARQVEMLRLAVSEQEVEAIAARFFAAQHAEGWFPEYGGPDFGYLAVTLDALADYFDATDDPRARQATERAVGFLARVLGADGRLPSTLNSRNTDYVVPYGLARAAQHLPEASWLLENLFRGAGDPAHFLWATDDRYHCHYIYASVVRSLPWIERRTEARAPDRVSSTDWLAGCGYWIRHMGTPDAPQAVTRTVYVAAFKGGMTRVHDSRRPPRAEFGLRVLDRGTGKLWTTNWWNPSNTWEIAPERNRIRVTGSLRSASPRVSTPVAHVGLRAAAFLFRERLIPWLKAALIFRDTRRRAAADRRFERTVTVHPDGKVTVDTEVVFPGADARVTPGPRQHLRHVASAESFHPEDLQAVVDASGEEVDTAGNGRWRHSRTMG